MRWWLAALAVLLLLAAGTVTAYYTSPRWLPAVVTNYAPRYGVTITRLEFAAPPTMQRIALRALALRRGTLDVQGEHIRLDFERQELADGRLRRVHATSLTVRLGPDPTAASAEPLPDPRTLWARLPVEHVRIDAFDFAHTSSGVHATGRVALTPEQLSIDARIAAPDVARGYHVRGTLTRAGALTARLLAAEPTNQAIARLDARWQGEPAQASASPPAVTLVDARLFARPTAAQLEALTALAGAKTTTGSLDLDIGTQLPWPLPSVSNLPQLATFVSSLAVTGHVRIDWRGAVPDLARDLRLRTDARFVREAGQPLHSVDVQLGKDTLLEGHWITTKPLRLFDQAMPTTARLEASAPLRMQLSATRARLDGPLRARIGDKQTYASVETRGPLLVNIDALRDGRFDGLRASGKIALALPRTSFARLEAQADLSVRGSGRALSIDLGRGAHLALGRLGDWTRGTTHARSRRPIAVTLNPANLRWRTAAVDAAIDLPRAEFAGTAARIDDAPLRLTEASGVGGDGIRARGSFASRLSAAERATNFTADAEVSLDGSRARTTGKVRLGRTQLPIGFRNDYDLARKRGSLLVEDSVSWKSALLADVLDGTAPTIDINRGNVRIDARADYVFVGKATQLKLAARLAWNGLGTTYADYRIDDVAGEARVTFDGERVSARDVLVRIGNAFVGVDVREIESRFDFDGKRIAAHYANARLLGGTARAGAFDYQLDGGNAALTVALDGIVLAEALALQDQGITGTGIIDGQLPLTIRGNVPEVRGGQIAARPPGGRIAYAKAGDYAKSIGQQGVEFAIAALQDFHYTRLDAGIDYDRSNVLTLAIKLHGRNPAVENGRLINYNLNVTQNVADLLRSLRATDEVTRQLEQRLQPAR